MRYRPEGVAVIPCRSGSKRIPRKNWVQLGGTSLWRIAAEAAAAVGREVVLVCDDPTADMEESGLQVLMPPDGLQDDTASAYEVGTWALREMQADTRGALAMLVLPTCPFRGPNVIRTAVEAWKHRPVASVMTARNGLVRAVDPLTGLAGAPTRGWLACGGLWVADQARAAQSMDGWYAPPCQVVQVSGAVALDIDTPDDLALAEAAWI